MATKVTALIKYDLFPHFVVVLGELQDNGDVRGESGVYAAHKVITTLPAHCYKDAEEDRKTAMNKYDESVTAARKSIMETTCSFLPLSYLQYRGYK